MFDFQNLVKKINIINGLRVSNKKTLFVAISNLVAKKIDQDKKLILKQLNDQENKTNSGILNGIAVPKIVVNQKNNIYFFIILSKPVVYDSADKHPVDLIFLSLYLKNDIDHLVAISEISGVLKNDELCKKLRATKKSEEIFSLLNIER